MARNGSGGRGVGVTKNRVVRVSDDVWDAAKVKAEREGTTVSEVIRSALVKYVSRPDNR